MSGTVGSTIGPKLSRRGALVLERRNGPEPRDQRTRRGPASAHPGPPPSDCGLSAASLTRHPPVSHAHPLPASTLPAICCASLALLPVASARQHSPTSRPRSWRLLHPRAISSALIVRAKCCRCAVLFPPSSVPSRIVRFHVVDLGSLRSAALYRFRRFSDTIAHRRAPAPELLSPLLSFSSHSPRCLVTLSHPVPTPPAAFPSAVAHRVPPPAARPLRVANSIRSHLEGQASRKHFGRLADGVLIGCSPALRWPSHRQICPLGFWDSCAWRALAMQLLADQR